MSNQTVRHLIDRLRRFPAPQPDCEYKGTAIVKELRKRYRECPGDFAAEDFEFLKALGLPRGELVTRDQAPSGGDIVDLGGFRYHVSDKSCVTLNNVQVSETIAVAVRAEAQPLVDARDEKLSSPQELLKEAAKAKRAGDLIRAEKLARRALDVEPGSLFAATTLSSIFRAKHDPEGAVALTEQHKNCSDPWLLTTRAAALQDAGRPADAAAAIKRAWACSDGKPSEELRNLYARMNAEGVLG